MAAESLPELLTLPPEVALELWWLPGCKKGIPMRLLHVKQYVQNLHDQPILLDHMQLSDMYKKVDPIVLLASFKRRQQGLHPLAS